MSAIELEPDQKDTAVAKLQSYFAEELDSELGTFQAQFLLDFFAEHIAFHYYNKGLADALRACEKKLDEVSDLIYELERLAPD